MVITGLTRNQFASNRTGVRIPLSPPKIKRATLVALYFYLFAVRVNVFLIIITINIAKSMMYNGKIIYPVSLAIIPNSGGIKVNPI